MQLKPKVMLIAALFMVSAVSVTLFDSEDTSAAGFTVTDGQGTEFIYDAPSNKVMTIGKGVTATVIELGYLDKIVVADSYSKTATEPVFNDFKTKISAGKILADGSIYSTGRLNLITDIVYAAENMGFDRDNDTIFFTGGTTYLAPFLDEMSGLGFKKILIWTATETYQDLVDYVEAVSMVVKGSTEGKADQMTYVTEFIKERLGNTPKANGFFVTGTSTETFKVGNTGSLASSMIIAAGGNSVTIDNGKAKPTYATNLTLLIRDYPDAKVFLDSTTANSPQALIDLRSAMPNVEFIQLESLWNNFAIDSMDGVWTMACAMYPDLFEGDVPTVPDDDSDNLILYMGVAAAIVVIISIFGVWFLRKG